MNPPAPVTSTVPRKPIGLSSSVSLLGCRRRAVARTGAVAQEFRCRPVDRRVRPGRWRRSRASRAKGSTDCGHGDGVRAGIVLQHNAGRLAMPVQQRLRQPTRGDAPDIPIGGYPQPVHHRPVHQLREATTAEVLRMVCAETACSTDPAADLAEAIRLRHDGPRLLDILSGLTNGAPQLTGLPLVLHHAAQGENSTLEAIITAEKQRSAKSPDVFSQGLQAATVCADWTWPWGQRPHPGARPGRDDHTSGGRAAGRGVVPLRPGHRGRQQTVAMCQPWPPTPVVPFPSTPDLPPVPTLLLVGDHDLITPLAWTQHEASHALHAHLVVIPGAGHITQTPATARQAAQPSPDS
jgi:pimeloyl-ACP methyl ester carboxylesterase